MDRQHHLSRPRADGFAVVVEQEVEVLGRGDEGWLVVGLGLVDAVDGQLLARYWKGLDDLVVGDVAARLHPRLDRLPVAVVNTAGVHLHQVRQLGPLREPVRGRQAVHHQGRPSRHQCGRQGDEGGQGGGHDGAARQVRLEKSHQHDSSLLGVCPRSCGLFPG